MKFVTSRKEIVKPGAPFSTTDGPIMPDLPAGRQMTLESVVMLLKHNYEDAINGAVEKALAHKVVDDKSEAGAIEMAGQAKRLFNALEVERKEKIKEQDAFVRTVNGLCKAFKDKLVKIEYDLKQKITRYSQIKEARRREEERKLKEEAEKIQRQLELDAKKKNIEPPPPPPPPVVKRETVTRTDSGVAAYTTSRWVYRIHDINKIPREWLMIDDKKVRNAISAGVRSIEGLIIEEEISTSLRV